MNPIGAACPAVQIARQGNIPAVLLPLSVSVRPWQGNAFTKY